MKLNKKAIAGVGLGALALVGGTFAYYSQTASLDNPLKTGSHAESLVEEFTPPSDEENLKPGQRWDKVVGAENTGDYPVLVRIKMEEKWQRKAADGSFDANATAYKTISSTEDGKKVDLFNNGIYDGTTKIFDAVQILDNDGVTPAEDGTVMHKILNIGTVAGTWIDGGDGYWYWNGVLEPKTKTTDFMSELVLATDVDLGFYETTESYVILSAEQLDENGKIPANVTPNWVTVEKGGSIRDITVPENSKMFRKAESKLVTGKEGYADSNYTLTITSEFVQATKDAVEDAWKATDGTPFDIDKLKDGVKVDSDGVNLVNNQ